MKPVHMKTQLVRPEYVPFKMQSTTKIEYTLAMPESCNKQYNSTMASGSFAGLVAGDHLPVRLK
jgi:hypothetical protein